MSNPWTDEVSAAAARLSALPALAAIPVVAPEAGDINAAIDKALQQAGVKAREPLGVIADPEDSFMAGYSTIDTIVASPGSAIRNGESYTYAISWLTAEGETELSGTFIVPTIAAPDQAILLFFAAPPARVTAIRLWRNSVHLGANLSLLAQLAPGTAQYDDTETHGAFAARMLAAIEPPATNSTAVVPKVGMCFALAMMSGRSEDESVSEAQDSTLHLELIVNPELNASDIGHGLVPLTVFWESVKQLISWDRGAGKQNLRFLNWDMVITKEEVTVSADFALFHVLDL